MLVYIRLWYRARLIVALIRLANEANERGKLIWSVVNKHHFFYHLGVQAACVNPAMTWTYMPEDFVGKVSQLGHGSAIGTGMHLISQKIAERIRIVRFLQLVRGLVEGDE